MSNPLFNISYGLYVVTAREMGKDNGCIANSVMQISDSPKTIALCLNKKNYTHDMIKNTGVFNISILTEEVPFKVIQNFGFQSGRDVNKFENCEHDTRSKNTLRYVPKYTNAFISGLVINEVDCGTHTLFIAEITESEILGNAKSVTYTQYINEIKPKPETSNNNGPKKTAWRCIICGYVYEGDTLPADYICPICGHGPDDFEKIEI